MMRISFLLPFYPIASPLPWAQCLGRNLFIVVGVHDKDQNTSFAVISYKNGQRCNVFAEDRALW